MYSVNKYQIGNQEITFIDIVLKNIDVTLMDYGAAILNINTPNKEGVKESVVIAYNEPTSYIEDSNFFNATVAPFAGRISNAEFKLNGETYKLDQNHLETECLHSGGDTLSFTCFDYEVNETKEYTEVIFTTHKKERTFPGNQDYTVTYKIYDSTVEMKYHVTTDKDTLVNITNHAYFNLSGNLDRTILDHKLYMNASRALKLDNKFSPQGIYDARGTHLDFTEMKQVKDNFFEGIYDLNEKGIDNPLLLDQVGLDIKQVELIDDVSGRTLEVYTSYPCVVCYTHNHINEKKLLFDKEHVRHMGICFEMQYEPNGINVEGLHDSILRKNEEYNETIIFKFGIKE
jgi:aldose 1-epimerase